MKGLKQGRFMKTKKLVAMMAMLLLASCSFKVGTTSENTNGSENSNTNTNNSSETSQNSDTSSEENVTTSFNNNTSNPSQETSTESNNNSSYESSSSENSLGGGSSSSSSSSSTMKEDDNLVVDQGIKSYGTYIEAFYATFEGSDKNKVSVEYKLNSDSTFTKLDQELIRSIGNNTIRFDAVGLKEGKYTFKITTDKNEVLNVKNIQVTKADRSGYAFYKNNEGVGAYNNDGTLKKNAIVVYVSEETKNTVKANGKTGIAAIMKSATSGTPMCIRIIGRIVCDTRNSSGSYEKKYTMINGLTDKPTDDGTYFNMLDVDNAKNLTLEGVGDDAEIYQWGLEFSKCSSLEVKNLTFSKYTDDACGIDGDRSKPSTYQRFFIHNNRFNVGENKFNDTPEHDKAEGDGATDIKGVSYATYAYNSYYNCHKTGLIGGNANDLTSHLTYHHNYYSSCQSRLPLGRQANMHYYNNVFEGTTNTCMDLRANAYAFTEANYFINSKNPVKTSKEKSYGTGVCKSFNDVFKSTSGTNNANKVSSREANVSNTCTFGKTFDTDPNNFYYDSVNKVSKVEHLTSAEVAYQETKMYAGVQKNNPTSSSQGGNQGQQTSSQNVVSSSSKNTSSSKSSTTSYEVPSTMKALFNASLLETTSYTSNFESQGFSIKARSDKAVDIVKSSDFTSFNQNYTKVLKLGGKGDETCRSIHFTINSDALVKIYARSGSTETRTLQLSTGGSAIDQFSVDGTAKMFETTLSKGTYCLFSLRSNIEIAAIEIY